jgi:hypothetical protein
VGLDIYAGPLTRYVAGAFEAAGTVPLDTGAPTPGRTSFTAERARARVLEWRGSIGPALGREPVWEGSESGDCQVWTVGFDGYHALLLLALGDEFPTVPTPGRIAREPGPELDREPLNQKFEERYGEVEHKGLRQLGRRKTHASDQRYPHLHFSTIWLPVDFPRPLRMAGPEGQSEVAGSLPRLRTELEGLNDRTLRAGEAQLKSIREEGRPEDGAFDGLARFGLATMVLAVRWADLRHKPVALYGYARP